MVAIVNLAFIAALVVGAWALTRIGSAERGAATQFLADGSVAGGTTLCSGAGCPAALPPVTASGSPLSGGVVIINPPPLIGPQGPYVGVGDVIPLQATNPPIGGGPIIAP